MVTSTVLVVTITILVVTSAILVVTSTILVVTSVVTGNWYRGRVTGGWWDRIVGQWRRWCCVVCVNWVRRRMWRGYKLRNKLRIVVGCCWLLSVVSCCQECQIGTKINNRTSYRTIFQNGPNRTSGPTSDRSGRPDWVLLESLEQRNKIVQKTILVWNFAHSHF